MSREKETKGMEAMNGGGGGGDGGGEDELGEEER
jgi:hypothetical protein